MKPLVLVACVKAKADRPLPAASLYESAWFKKAIRYGYLVGEPYILSAKYGLISSSTIIAPYDQTLNSMSIKERRDWSIKVAAQVREVCVIHGYGHLMFLAGRRYRDLLSDHLRDLPQSIPMEGMGIGEQLQWLNHRINEAP